jgi:hypothetical protein
MFTYDVVSESVRNPQQLAAELTKRSANGWEVVHIAFDGSAWFHAFIRHAGNVPVGPSAAAGISQPVASSTPAAPTAATPAAASTGDAPSVPADWHKDPSGRFELRYWNGTAWTEHVATGGKQSIDPVR